MTAAYDEDAISGHRQEHAKNSEAPVDFASQKMSEISVNDSERKEGSVEIGKGTNDTREEKSSISSSTIDDNEETRKRSDNCETRHDSETRVVGFRNENRAEEIVSKTVERDRPSNANNIRGEKQLLAANGCQEDSARGEFEEKSLSLVSEKEKNLATKETEGEFSTSENKSANDSAESGQGDRNAYRSTSTILRRKSCDSNEEGYDEGRSVRGGAGNEEDEEYDPECEMNFHEAVRMGDAKSVEKLVARGLVQNVDEPDWNVSGDPPLLVAATNHSLPVLRTLLTNGCDPAVRSPRGETALHRVIVNGGPSNVLEIVDELLKHGCPATVKEAGGGLTALHVLTRQLAHAQSSKSLQYNFETALRTLDLLAKVGPVNAKDHQGRSALHILASSSSFGNSHRIEIEPMIKTLLNAGADPALQNDRGETPLHEALECGALNTAFLLVPHTPTGITSRYGETPLHIAARKNQTEVVENLLKRGENPSLQDAGGNTPLHLASARGFHHTISLLVTSPLAQLEKTNDEGLTSLQVAAESGFVNAVRLLLKAGADPSQTARYCVTTLHRHPDISTLIDHELTRRRQLAA